jgi:amidohydrolase
MVARRARLFTGFALLAACGASSSQNPVAPILAGPVMDQVNAVLARDEPRLIELRRDLHRHPELSNQEVRTSGIVAGEMRRLGLEVRTHVGGHGVVAVLRGRRPGPLVAWRADMDAVPSSAQDPVEFRSLTPGVRHICGHDIHTTVGMALAAALAQVRDSLTGSVMFVFQPAEERATGARAMLADGVFSPDQPAAIYGLHTAPYEAGRLGTTAGPMMAGRDRFDVVLSGGGDLTAATADLRQRLNALGTIDASQIGVAQPPDFVLMQLEATQASPGQVRLRGTVIVASAASRARVQSAIVNGLQATLPANLTVATTYEARWIAGVTNDSALTSRAAAAVRTTLGSAALATVTTLPPAFSEDFGSFQERVPGVFFYLGVSNASRGWNGQPHHPDYVADERSIVIGARAMAAVLLDRLQSP